MKKLTLIKNEVDYGVTTIDGMAVVSSRRVAEIFNKRHDHVLESIRNCGCSKEFALPNFRETYYRDSQGKKQPEVLMTKDGFAFIVMGFTGKKAAQFKETYINRFNEMEHFIRSRNLARIEYPELTEAIKMMHDDPKFYHYSNEADMINRIVLGMSAKQFRKENGLDKGESMRGQLRPWEAEAIQRLQEVDVGLVVIMPDFKQRKKALQRYFETMKDTIQSRPMLSEGKIISNQ